MAKTIDELKAQGAEIKNATVVGENTATRVGTLFTDIVEHVEEYEAGQTAITEANTNAIKAVVLKNEEQDQKLSELESEVGNIVDYNLPQIPTDDYLTDQALQIGGGRFSKDGYNIRIANGVSASVKRIRIVAYSQEKNEQVAAWGVYTANPTYTTEGTPVKDNYVRGASYEGSYINETFEFNINGYLLITTSPNSIVKLYDETIGVKDLEQMIGNANANILKNTELLTENYLPQKEGYLNHKGNIISSEGSGFFVTEQYIPINEHTIGGLLLNICTEVRIGVFGLAFYDENKNIINDPYWPPTIDDGETINKPLYNIVLDSNILDLYPNASYFRYTTFNEGWARTNNNEFIAGKFGGVYNSIKRDILYMDDSYKLAMVTNVVCIGDSVTRGLLVENGNYVDGETSDTIPVIHASGETNQAFSYPAQLQKMVPHWTVTNGGQSGNEAMEFWTGLREGQKITGFSDYNFEDFDIAVVEFGWNYSRFGILEGNDVNVENTNSWAMCKIIEGIYSQNNNCKIFLLWSSHHQWGFAFFNYIRDTYPYVNIVNLDDSKYIWLDSKKYHDKVDGYYDFVHFTKEGYNAKAFIVRNSIIASL